MALSDWTQIQSYLEGSNPVSVALAVAGDARIEVDPSAPALRFVVKGNTTKEPALPDLAQIDLSLSSNELQMRVANPDLFESFHQLVSEIALRIDADPSCPIDAVRKTMVEWRALLEQKAALPRELVLGLSGELWFLEALIRARGEEAIETWTGPGRESHDFRFGALELEVKTTSGQNRNHIIHGIKQLTASPSSVLHLLSLRMGGANDGRTLAERVATIRPLLTAGNAAEGFETRVARAVPSMSALERSRERLRLLDEPRLIEASSLLRIDEAVLSQINGVGTISDISYRLDVTGEGLAPADDRFAEELVFLRETSVK